MNNKEKETFHYTYSAKQQKEIDAIRNKYLPPEEQEDKMAQLRKLDASVTKKATIHAVVIGIIGALILGLGMSLAMTEIAEIISLQKNIAIIIGIIIGLIGIVLVCLAYPIYNHTLRKERERIAPEIIKLTDELMK